MPRKRPSGPPKRPKAVRKARSLSQEPSKPLEAPPVAPEPYVSSTVNVIPNTIDRSRDVWNGQPVHFETAWGLLTSRQREYVRGVAEERGVTLQGLYGKFPQLWPV